MLVNQPTWFSRLLVGLLLAGLTGCFRVPYYGKPVEDQSRPEWVNNYYDNQAGYQTWRSEPVGGDRAYKIERIWIQSKFGETVVDYYRRPQPSEQLILVFPVLGGKKNIIASYFAEVFARGGFDAAIVHRDEKFKDPANFDKLEEIMRDGVIRDRLAMDFFEREFGKKKFGSFGISRGAINVAISAGVDPRLEYNVMVMGGTKLVHLFAKSKERRIRKYRRRIQAERKISGEEFIELLTSELRTDPVNLAHFMNPTKTLMILSLFDNTVPIRYGRQLRDQVGKPDTIYLLADHRTSVLYTQFVPLFPPHRCLAIFPFDYVETEALAFYHKSFRTGSIRLKHMFFNLLQVPFMLGEKLGRVFN